MSSAAAPEFSGLKGHFFAWMLTSPLRRVFEWKMGKPDDRLLELLDLDGSEQVLDAGCGSGFHTLLLAEQLPTGRVIGTDVSKEMLDRLRRNAKTRGLVDRVKPMLADNLDLDIDDGSMDRAISVAAWHHLADPQRACRELVRTLRPGGRAVVIDLVVEPSKKAVPGLAGHDRPFTPADMREIFEQAGLVDVQVETLGRWVIGAGDRKSD